MAISNGDTPAMPTSVANSDGCLETSDTATGGYGNGLTKREQFAAMAMQGLLSNSLFVDCCTDVSLDYVAASSVEFAGALLKELDK